MKRVYCLAEDRGLEEVGLRFAISSLLRANAGARVVVYRPNPSQDFRGWISAMPGVELVPGLPPGASSWNCKPHTLLPILESGADEAIWLDSDILVTRDPSALFDGLPRDVLLGAEEFPTSPDPKGFAVRTRAWGLEVGRDSPITLNSCVLRVTQAHVPLLKRWHELLADPQYIATQKKGGDQRPFHLISDQDVLNALLGSAPFSQVPVRFLRIGRDVIHCGGAVGYSLSRRLGDLFRPAPPFLHSIAGKPWYVFHPEYPKNHSRWFTWYRRLLQEVSPYYATARKMRGHVGMPCPWLDAGSRLGWCMQALGFGNCALLGLPLVLAATTALTTRNSFRRLFPNRLTTRA